jgi:carboxypeptidase Taq
MNSDLRARLVELAHLSGVAALLSWDQEVMMPHHAVDARSMQAAIISEQLHQLHTSDTFKELLAAEVVIETGELLHPHCDPLEASALTLIYKDWKKASRLPVEFVSELAHLTSQSQHHWQLARKKSDFSIFAPFLEKIIEKNKEKAILLGFSDTPYDGLLDEFEPGMTSAQLTPLFARVRDGIKPILSDILKNQGPAIGFGGVFDPETQLKLCKALLADMTFDYGKGRMDISTHPFTTQFHPSDVRLTIRTNEFSPLEAISSTLHEGGHALYEQGLSAEWFGTPIGEASSLGVHESQSRIWENCIGLSRPFWEGFYPKLKGEFPALLGDLPLDDFYRHIKYVRPSFIRVEADEVTYHMHIFIRYELEQLIFNGQLSVSELPAKWNALYEEYLGITPPDDASGVLQDVHWSCGLFGYFPTYTLGTLLSHQFFDQAMRDIKDLEVHTRRGDFRMFSRWLKENIHQYGRSKTSAQLVRDICGSEISEVPYLDYLKQHYLYCY